MSIKYRYFGIMTPNSTPDKPAGVVRVWRDEQGFQGEETFSYNSLDWTRSYLFLASARPGDEEELVEIDEAAVGWYIEETKGLRRRMSGAD